MKAISRITSVLAIIATFSSCRVYIPEYTTVPEIYNLRQGMTREEVTSTLGVQPVEFYASHKSGHKVLVYKYKKSFQRIPKDSIYEPEFLNKRGLENFKEIGDLYVLLNGGDSKLDYFMTQNGRKLAPGKIDDGRKLEEAEINPQDFVRAGGVLKYPSASNDELWKGYSFGGEAYIGSGMVGFMAYNNYSIGTFHSVGLGVGVEYCRPLDNFAGMSFRIVEAVDSLRTITEDDYNGIYIPITIKYEFELNDKRNRPYFLAEGGYLLNTAMFKDYRVSAQQSVTANRNGGPMASVGFGVRFQSKKRHSFSIQGRANFRSYWIQENFTEVLPNQSYSGWQMNITPVIGFGFKF